ncbi:MAG: peptidase M4 [Candidatus Tectimicrobiota bacterium]
MATYPEDTTASTPDATAAVAQSRLGVPAARTAEPQEAFPTQAETFRIGPGVERAASAHPHEHQSGDPLYRPLRIFTLDPAASRFEGAVTTVNVPYEPLTPGPCGAMLAVDNYDGCQQVHYQRLNLDDPKVLLQDGRTPSPSDPLFHQQMVYTVCSTVSAAFQRALGRHIAWGFDSPDASAPTRLRLRPHAFKGRNAYYNRSAGEICFGYFRAEKKVTGRNPPAGFVFTCLSHDIVAHEVTHALLDGLRGHYTYPSSPDMLAFHEAFADLVALLQRFSYTEVVETAFRTARGRLEQAHLLTGLAKQFGETTGFHKPLRNAIDDLDQEGMPVQRYRPDAEAHALGSVLVAAVFEAFLTVFKRKTTRYVRLATSGTGELPAGEIPIDLQHLLAAEASQLANQFLTICIRAIDYCPPVDLQLGEFLRALITADYDLVPADPWGYREALIDAFWRRELYPPHVPSLFEDALLWRPTTQPLPCVEALTFAELKFAGDPGHPAGARELRRQAAALGALVSRPEYMAEFGLAPPGHPALRGDSVDLPCVESIRSTRRVGPNGQIVFDLVAEVSQRRTIRRRDGSPEFDYYGGATVILGPNGAIRYAISKSVLNQERYEQQRAFIHGQGQAYWQQQLTGEKCVPHPQLFRLLDGAG